MTRSLRRSRRATKKLSEYNVGDVVEVRLVTCLSCLSLILLSQEPWTTPYGIFVSHDHALFLLHVQVYRGDSVVNGRLAQLLTEGTSPNPRWLVNLIGQNKHEEMYEKSFGKLISQAEDDSSLNNNPAASSSSPPSSSQRRAAKPNGGGVSNKKGSNGKNSGTSSEGEGGDELKAPRSSRHVNSKKSVSFTDGSQGGSDESTPEGGAETKMSGLDKVSARYVTSLF